MKHDFFENEFSTFLKEAIKMLCNMSLVLTIHLYAWKLLLAAPLSSNSYSLVGSYVTKSLTPWPPEAKLPNDVALNKVPRYNKQEAEQKQFQPFTVYVYCVCLRMCTLACMCNAKVS